MFNRDYREVKAIGGYDMNSILKHIVRNIFEKKIRTTIVLLTIIATTVVLFIGLSLNGIINDTYTTMLKGAYGDSNIMMAKASDDRYPFYNYTDINTKRISIEKRHDMINATGKSFLDGESIKVSLSGMDVDKASQMGFIAPINNIEGFNLKDNFCVISQKTAADYQLSLGDSIKVVVNNKTYEYKVGAISEKNGIFYTEIDHILLVVSVDQINNIYETDNLFSATFVKVPQDDLDKAITTLAKDNPNFTIQKTSAAGTNMRDAKTFHTTMMLAIIIIVLISAYVILSLSKIIITERMPVVGTFRSLGTSKRMMNSILIVEFLFYGLLGTVLGIVLACALLPVIADIFNEFKDFGVKTKVSYHIGYMVLTLAFGIFFPAFVSMVHILSVNKKPLKEMILNTSHTLQKQSGLPAFAGVLFLAGSFGLHHFNQMDHLYMALISIVLLFISIVFLIPILLNAIAKGCRMLLARTANGEMILGIKNIANNKTVSNNSSMIIVVFILLLMIGMARAGLDEYLNSSLQQDYDVVVNHLDKEPSEYEEIKNIDGVSDYHIQYLSTTQYEIKGDIAKFGIYGVDDFKKFDQFYSGVTFIGDPKEQMEKYHNGVIIDKYQAERYSLNVGDSIQLQPLDSQLRPLYGEGAYIEAIVAGFMESSGFTLNRASVLVNLQYFKDHFDDSLNQIVVKVNSDIDPKHTAKNILEKYVESNINVHTFEEMIAWQKATIDTLMSGITVIIFMGMIVGLLGITNNLIISFIQRKKEYAVLYSVCMSRNQIIKMLFFEMITTFLAVAIIGCLGGLAMNVVMSKLLYAIGMRVQFPFNTELYGILCGVVFVLLALSTIAIVRKVVKINMIEELRYE